MAPSQDAPCGSCKKNVKNNQNSIKCNGFCGLWYHVKCSGLSNKQFRAYCKPENTTNFVCLHCNEDGETEVGNSDENAVTAATTSKEPAEITLTDIYKQLKKMEKNHKDEIEQLKDSINFTNGMLEDQIKQNNKLQEQVKMHENKCKKLENEIINLNNRIGTLEQRQRLNNVVIAGIPKQPSETVEETVEKVLKAAEVDLKKGDIMETYRLNKLEESPIMVCFRNKAVKMEVMEKKKQKKSLFVNEAGLNGKNNIIYFNEDLSPETQEIFRAARKLKTFGYAFVWCKQGKVYARKEANAEVIAITNIEKANEIITRCAPSREN